MKNIILFFAFLLNVFFSNAQKSNVCCKVSDLKNCIKPTNDTCCCEDDPSIKCINPATQTLVNTCVITYDFKTKNIAFPNNHEKFKKGDAVKIKVTNLNPFIYKVVINNTDSNYKAVVDANNLLSAIGTLSNLSSIVSGISSGGISTPIVSGSSNMEAILKNELKGSLNEVLAENFATSALLSKTKSSKKNNLSGTQPKDLDDFFNGEKTKIVGINQNSMDLKKQIDSKNYAWQRLLKAERQSFPYCSDFTALTSGDYINSIKADYDAILTLDQTYLKTIVDNETSYLIKITTFKDALNKDNAGSYRSEDSLFKVFYSQAFTTLNKVDSALSTKVIEPITESLESIEGLKLCYLSNPFFFSSDSKVISLQVKPWKDSLPNITDAPIVFELPWQQHHIWGVSAGVFGSFLHNEEYSSLGMKNTTSTADTNTTYSIKKNNSGTGEFGIDGLAYTGWELGDNNNFYLGGSFGAGLTLENKPKPRIFLGGSIIYGTRNRIMLSAGGVAGFVDRLAEVYLGNMTELQSNPTNVTTSVMKINLFISLNYSF